ncbi:response regulator transcription factor [Clostridium sp. MB40-C1]|uniref:response regulator transcription factor n=1 Tax=Clostridium sp. MB40-C1 TaxID=3070996 RepID=UPI0027E1575C|nr:response regulator transcription factor [Clostridium sp. MB40-C1]WMJ81705.1 response regulator transcription factor [Clostridium sp. MB40-C1]
MKNNILVIEDEKSVSDVIKAYLEKEGYEVYCTYKGIEAIEIFKSKEFKLVILDLMLPDISGEEVCKNIRKISDVNIFMLTAKGTLTDKIEGLNMGADEYLVKPFSPRELTARVNALFRRLNSDDKEDKLKFNNGNLIIDKIGREVKVGGKQVNLTPNEFDILYTLAINKGKVLTREKLIEKVFTSDFDGFDRTIDAHIKNIRKKIEEDSKNPKYIITIIKAGYKFIGEN